MSYEQRTINEVQSGIIGQAEKVSIPERFEVSNIEGQPAKKITDSKTGRSTVVPLYAYSNVRKALSDFFGE